MNSLRMILCCALLTLLLGACAGRTENRYDPALEQSMLTIQHGVITQARDVKIAGSGGSATTSPQVGIGMGHGRRGGMFGGIGIGILSGGRPDDSAYEREAQELTIRLEDGQDVVVVQASENKFSSGDPVRILKAQDGKTHVQPE